MQRQPRLWDGCDSKADNETMRKRLPSKGRFAQSKAEPAKGGRTVPLRCGGESMKALTAGRTSARSNFLALSGRMSGMGEPRRTLEPEWRRAATPWAIYPYVRYARKAAFTELDVFYSGYALNRIPAVLRTRAEDLLHNAVDLRRDRRSPTEYLLVAYGPDDEGVLASCAADRWADVYAASMKWQQRQLSPSVLQSLGIGSNPAVESLPQLF